MKLSILVPTHNRPKLFTRCLNAILPQLRSDIQVIVNNDSCDIQEISHPNVAYHYNKFEHLSSVYKFLLEQSTGEYVYFSEDDDYVVKDFTSILLDADLIGGNYYPKYHQSNTLPCMTLYKDVRYNSFESFNDATNKFHLQLSQYIFKRSSIINFPFPLNSDIHNDLKLVMHAAQNATSIKSVNKILFHQTIDGNDNISFPHLQQR